MTFSPPRPALLLVGLALPAVAAAQGAPADAPPPPPSDPAPETEIVVTAPSARGEAIGGGTADIRIGGDAIASYGAESIGTLLADLKPQTGESPVILVNGKRISGVSEIAQFPPEAIARIDILPEEVSLAYGYRADQKVVNIILERRFRATTVKASTAVPTEGGRSDADVALNILRIANDTRTSLDLAYARASKLSEAERDLPGPDARFRTLMPRAESLKLGATLARPLAPGISATLDASAERRSGASLFGLASGGPGSPRPLRGRTEATSLHVGTVLAGRMAPWSWSFTGGFDHGASLARTDRAASDGSVGTDMARSLSNSLAGDLVVNGPLAALPAGRLGVTLKAVIARRVQQSRSERSGVAFARQSANSEGQLSANLNLPIASRRAGVLKALGDLSANLNLQHDGISGIGTADSLGYGLSWAPIRALRITATLTRSDGLPPQAQRDDPILVTPNVPIYDFVRGETVLASRIDGGNPALAPDSSRIFSLTANLAPLGPDGPTLNLGYTRSRTLGEVGALPAATAAIEAAFPDRFVRDSGGRLLSVDARPVNFARARQEQLRWGLFWSKPLGQPRNDRRPDGRAPSAEADAGAGTADGAPGAEARGGFGEGGFGGSRGSGPGGRFGGRGRLLLSLSHVWRIQNDLLIRDGLPLLDLLGGDAFGGRGQARHEIDARANVMKDGLGLAIEGKWQSGSQLNGSVSRLRFSDLATFNLRLFANLGQLPGLETQRFWQGARLSLDVDNLFDARMRVQDQAGNTPLGYSPAYLDPLGRTLKVSLRKLF